jgi:hypothetical protein
MPEHDDTLGSHSGRHRGKGEDCNYKNQEVFMKAEVSNKSANTKMAEDNR